MHVGSDNAGRSIHFIETTEDGKAIAFVYNNGFQQSNQEHGREQIGMVQKIAFNTSTGALLAGTVGRSVEAGEGRAGDAMSFDSTSNKLYYAFGAGAFDQNAIDLKEATFRPSDNTVVLRTVGSNKRFNVLHSGR